MIVSGISVVETNRTGTRDRRNAPLAVGWRHQQVDCVPILFPPKPVRIWIAAWALNSNSVIYDKFNVHYSFCIDLLMNRVLGWLIALTMLAVRLTCRRRVHNDRRQEVLDSGKTYIYGQLHAHQIAAGMFGEAGTVAMVSRSSDGDIVAPMLKIFRKQLVRGSSGRSSKGGASALQQMIRKVRDGHRGVIAVDGPRGPRGSVQKGIGFAAKKSGMPVMPVILVPNRRLILTKAWDRLQIPMPFCRVDVYFGDPISVGPDDDLAAFAATLGSVLHDLEAKYDPAERQPRSLSTPQLRAA